MLQPLDVGVFGPFQRGWIDRCDEIVEDTGEEMPREDFVREYMAVRKATFKPETIISAFRKSGIKPLNPNIFTNEDYAPSIPTSTAAHVPTSYPTRHLSAMPTSLVFGNWEEDELATDSDTDSSDSDYDDNDNDSDSDGSDDSNDENDINDDDDRVESQTTSSNRQPTSSLRETPPNNSQPSQGQDPRQLEGDHSPRSTTSNLQGQQHPLGLQHPEGVHPSTPSSTTSTFPSITPESFYRTSRRSTRSPSASAQASIIMGSSGESRKDLQAQIAKLIVQNEALSSRVAFLEAHCSMAVSEIRDLKTWMNARDQKKKKKKLLNVNARCLNSDEGMIACDRRDEEERRKAEEKGKAAARKLAKEQERERVRAERGPVTAFVGALSSKNKPDLQEIAEALALSKDGTKQELQDRINGYFIAYPRFKEDPKYLGLFLRGNRGQKRPAQAISNDQNTPPEGLNGPQTNRPRHDLEPGPSTSTMSRSLSRDTINIIRSAPVSHLRYPDTSLVPNYTHHLQHNTTYPFHGPPSQYIHPHVVSQAEHGNQHTPPHNLYLNMTPPVHNNYHYSPSQS